MPSDHADGLPPLREVIGQLKLTARKSLGQNFLLDLNLTRRIARAAGPLHNCRITEIGPGPGGLTRALLLEGAAHVTAIECDARVAPALEDIARAWPGRVEIIRNDALKTDWRALWARTAVAHPGQRQGVVANLPYNIATALIVQWMRHEPWPPPVAGWTVLLQREVADRLTAPPGNGSYGRLSVLCQWRCRVAKLFDINPRAFTPPPKITSSLVQLEPRYPRETLCALTRLETVTQAAFGQRRKMLRSSLKSLGIRPSALLERAGIGANLRAEQLTVADFCRLAAALDALDTLENRGGNIARGA